MSRRAAHHNRDFVSIGDGRRAEIRRGNASVVYDYTPPPGVHLLLLGIEKLIFPFVYERS